MPRYYFDTHDGFNFNYDNRGMVQALRQQAIRSLCDMTSEELPD